MVSFTVRVQLNGYPEPQDYDKLHDEMRRRGFSRLIRDGKTGQWHHLPHAEYDVHVNGTRLDVLAEAKAAAATVSADFEVLVTESEGRTWHNLRPATPLEVLENQPGA